MKLLAEISLSGVTWPIAMYIVPITHNLLVWRLF